MSAGVAALAAYARRQRLDGPQNTLYHRMKILHGYATGRYTSRTQAMTGKPFPPLQEMALDELARERWDGNVVAKRLRQGEQLTAIITKTVEAPRIIQSSDERTAHNNTVEDLKKIVWQADYFHAYSRAGYVWDIARPALLMTAGASAISAVLAGYLGGLEAAKEGALVGAVFMGCVSAAATAIHSMEASEDRAEAKEIALTCAHNIDDAISGRLN